MTTAVIIPTLDPESEMCVAAVDAVAESAPDVFVIVEHDRERAGFAQTCNAGAARTTADVLVFLNDDTVVLPGWLDPLVEAVGGPESGVIAGSRLLYPDGQIQHTGVFLRRDSLGRLEAYNRRSDRPSGEVPAVTGACLAIDRESWDRLAGFDEAFVNGYEDVDLCLRHRAAGGTVRYCAESTVIHFESRSPGRFDHAPQNLDLLQQRWSDLLKEVA